ncbi:MAG: asparagine synthase (glutamine-hydrolyzing) [Magnetospirillum sp.]|nr:asparagine synthase (glutamine-hydrolyzing) [Magnetospirillum sp.]
MCGLAGLFLPKTSAVVDAPLDAMLATMRHRGPDGTGSHISDDHRFQGAFTRLAIIDLVSGDQPLVENGGERVFLGNGEIYNYRELRSELQARGHVFRTQGDMEPALKLFTEKGRDFAHDLNGMYALAVFERDAHRLTLVRDRLGIKPLYWSRLAGGGVIFVSEVKALFASGLVEPQVDESTITTYLAHGYVPAPRTLFRGVNKLPPGHMLIADAQGEIRIERYWRPGPAPDLPGGETEIKQHLTALLGDAVRLQLRSDVPVGALLSGGVDSGLMVALAAQALDRPLNTYTVRFQGAAYDETPLAAMVAQRYGTRHTVFELSTDSAAQMLPKLAWFCDEPLFDASLLPNHLINQLLGRETRVVLNGSGGDELFAGYGRYFRNPAEQRYLSLPGLLRKNLVEPIAAVVNPLISWQLARAAKFDQDRGGYLHDHTTQFPPFLRRKIGHRGEEVVIAQRAAFAEFQGPADTGALYADLLTYLPEDLLLLLDRTTMASSVEGRVPFLDHRFVEAALAVPPHIRAPGGRQKALERQMAADFLPAEILNAPKQGFASPVPAWMAGSLADPVRRLLLAPRTLARGYWSKEGVEYLLADPRKHAFRLYSLMMLELTIRLHVEQRLPTPPTASLAEIADA